MIYRLMCTYGTVCDNVCEMLKLRRCDEAKWCQCEEGTAYDQIAVRMSSLYVTCQTG
jgi:hypothetical protein